MGRNFKANRIFKQNFQTKPKDEATQLYPPLKGIKYRDLKGPVSVLVKVNEKSLFCIPYIFSYTSVGSLILKAEISADLDSLR